MYIDRCILKCCLYSTNVRLFTTDIAPDVFSLYEYKKKIHIRHAHTRSNHLHYIYRYTHNDIRLHPHIKTFARYIHT